MKIAFILPSLANRGPIIFTHYLLRELIKNDVQMEVFYFDDSKANILDLGVKSTQISFYRKNDFSDFDIVHTTMARPDIYACRFVPKEKWVCSMHNYLVEDMRFLYNPLKSAVIIFLWKTAIKKCWHIVTSSNQMTDYYRNLIGKTKNYYMIPYGVYDKEFADIEEKDFDVISGFKKRGLKIIGSVGLLIERKGFSQIFAILQCFHDTALVIIGEGRERCTLEKIISDEQLSDRVFLPGFRNNSYNYYQYFDIYAHVSYSEGFGLAMLEAMSKKLPIICSNLPIYKDYFTDDEVSLFEPGDSSSLLRAYENINAKYEMYREASYNLFGTKFKAEIMGKEHLHVYKDIIDSLKVEFFENNS